MDGGQTKTNVSGWTTDTLHTHIQSLLSERDRFWLQLLDERDRRYNERFIAQERESQETKEAARAALTKAETSIDRRLENTNEWRETLSDRERLFMPRAEYDRAHEDLAERVEAGHRAMEEKYAELSRRLDRDEGRGVGFKSGWGYILGGLGLFISIVTLIFLIIKT